MFYQQGLYVATLSTGTTLASVDQNDTDNTKDATESTQSRLIQLCACYASTCLVKHRDGSVCSGRCHSALSTRMLTRRRIYLAEPLV